MRLALKILIALIIVYVVLVLAFRASGVCPKYINLMPKVVESGVKEKTDWGEIFSGLKLCPFSEKVY